jgi:hypothetical protein
MRVSSFLGRSGSPLSYANAAWAYLGFWEKVGIAHKPGFRAAAPHIQERRGPGEPVLVCSPLAYLPIRYHCRPAADCYLYDDGRDIPHYYGRR